MEPDLLQDQLAEAYATAMHRMHNRWRASAHPLVKALEAENVTAKLLKSTQYAAHLTAELVVGLAPPASAADAHVALIAQLARTRDEIAQLSEQLEEETTDAHDYANCLTEIATTEYWFVDAISSVATSIQAWHPHDATALHRTDYEESRRTGVYFVWLIALSGTAIGIALAFDLLPL